MFLDRATVRAPLRRPAFPHEWTEFPATRPGETAGRIAGASLILTNKVRLGAAELAQAPALKYIGVTATGYDNVDLGYCRAHRIAVSNAPAYAGDSVPEHVLMLMLALRRNLPAYQEAVRAGRWQHSPVPSLSERPVYDLKGAVLGLIGYGELARRVDVLARAFGMTVCVAERKGSTVIRPGRAAFERVLRKSDIVSLHCPLTPETRGMIGRAEIAMMKRGAILINTARGPVIDDAAVADALRSAQLGGAGVDVLTEEPPRSGNPLLDPGLPNVIVTPHIAWTSQAALAALADIVIANMESFVKGEPKNIVS